MYRLCLFVWVVCVLNRPAACSPTGDYTSISNRDAISEEDKIQALENSALLEGDLVAPAKENSTEDRGSAASMHSVARISPRWPNAIIYFKLDKRFYGEFWGIRIF